MESLNHLACLWLKTAKSYSRYSFKHIKMVVIDNYKHAGISQFLLVKWLAVTDSFKI